MSFEFVGVCEGLIKATEERQWSVSTDVQDEAIPLILGGSNVMIAAETGTGKTASFCLPLLQIVNEISKGGHTELRFNGGDADPIVHVEPTYASVKDTDQGGGVRTSAGVVSGKWAYEVRMSGIRGAGGGVGGGGGGKNSGMTPPEAVCRVGWATATASRQIGTDRESFGYGSSGKKSFARNFDQYGPPFEIGDVIGCFLDLQERVVWYSHNGNTLPVAHRLPPTMAGRVIYPAVFLKYAAVSVNFGDRLRYPHLPSGFRPLQDALSERSLRAETVLSGQRGPSALILEPTQELCHQVYQEIDLLKHHLDPVPTHATTHGALEEVVRALQAAPRIVIGTPQRIYDLARTGALVLGGVALLCVDEADHFAESSQAKQAVVGIHKSIVAGNRKPQVVICSATLHSPEIRELGEIIAPDAQWVDLKGRDAVPNTVHHIVVQVDPVADECWKTESVAADYLDNMHLTAEKESRACQLSRAIKLLKLVYLRMIVERLGVERAIVFCRTQADCDNVARYLSATLAKLNTFTTSTTTSRPPGLHPIRVGGNTLVAVFHGGRSKEDRAANLKMFASGTAKLLICTDVAARGLDIKHLPYVINMTLPETPETYIHRVGRVGRAERKGLAISLVSKVMEKVWYHTCGGVPQCSRRDLIEEEGCAMWYDETSIVLGIEKRLKSGPLPTLTKDSLSLDPSVLVRMFSLPTASELDYRSQRHVAFLRSTSEELARLETDTQLFFTSTSTRSERWRASLR